MNEELTPQKERFLQEVERTILRKELDVRLLEDGLVHVSWNEKPGTDAYTWGYIKRRSEWSWADQY